MSVEERVLELLAPVVATVGVELIDVEHNGGTLRVTVDEESGITSERLAEVNRLISPLLDQHDPIAGRYTLEVSSPGLERPLRTADHYRRAVSETIIVKLNPDQETRRLRGTLVSVDDNDDDGFDLVIDVTEVDGVELDEDERRQVDPSNVSSARTVFAWGPGPKPGQPTGKKKKSKNAAAKKTKSPSQPRGV